MGAYIVVLRYFSIGMMMQRLHPVSPTLTLACRPFRWGPERESVRYSMTVCVGCRRDRLLGHQLGMQ